MRRTVTAAVLAMLMLGSVPAGATGLTGDEASAAAAAFRAAYGADVEIRFVPEAQGATFLGGFRTGPLGSTPVAPAWNFLIREARILGMDEPRTTLAVDRVLPWRGWTHVRFRQIAGGLDVVGHGFVVVTDDAGRVYQVSGRFADATVPAGLDLLTPAEAKDRLRRRVETAEVESLRPVVSVVSGTARRGYLAVVETGGPLDRFEVLQDAETGVAISAHRLFREAQGKVYQPNPEVDPTVYTVDLPNLLSTTNLDGTYASAWACSDSRCRSRTRRAVPDTDGNYLFDPVDPSTTDEFAEVQAYFHIDRVNAYFADSVGYSYTCDGSSVMPISVNMDYPNAFFGDIDRDGCGDVVMGQGTVVDFAYDADVVYHEFVHGVVGETAGLEGWGADELGPDYSSGGLNEGTADYFSVSLSDDPMLGEYAAHEGAMGELDIRNAVNDRVCPQNLSGESHNDGEIWVGTTWEIRTALGAAKTDAVVMATLLALSSEADFDEAGRGLISAAERLVADGTLTAADQAEVERIATARGLPGCERVIDLLVSPGQAFSYGIEDLGGWVDELATGVQFKIRTPADAVRARFSFTLVGAGGAVDPSAFTVYVRRGAPVHFTRSGYSLTVDGYDFTFDIDPTGMGGDHVTLTQWSTPPVESETDYYATVIHSNPSMFIMTVTGEVASAPPRPEIGEEEDAATDAELDTLDASADVEEDVPGDVAVDTIPPDVLPDVPGDALPDTEPTVNLGGGSGCGCRVAPAPTASIFALLGLLFTAFVLRRK